MVRVLAGLEMVETAEIEHTSYLISSLTHAR